MKTLKILFTLFAVVAGAFALVCVLAVTADKPSIDLALISGAVSLFCLVGYTLIGGLFFVSNK